jgi:adenine deaminase
MLCTDDRHPEDLLREGHLDAIIRKAVNKGVKPAHAIKMCTLNTATYFGLKDYGAIAPGYHADIVVLSDFIDFTVEQVYIDGKAVAKYGAVLNDNVKPIPDCEKVLRSFHMQPVKVEKLYLPIKERQRVIGLKKRELLTDEIIIQPTEHGLNNNGIDIARDVLKAAVFERHHNTGKVGLGFLKGYGIRKGALALSVAHDSHNVICVGVSNEEMQAAVRALINQEGGFVLVRDGKVIASLALPIAGLMSDQSGEDVAKQLKILHDAAHQELGVSEDVEPVMTLCFMSLIVIPDLKITDRGLFDMNSFQFVPLELEEKG